MKKYLPVLVLSLMTLSACGNNPAATPAAGPTPTAPAPAAAPAPVAAPTSTTGCVAGQISIAGGACMAADLPTACSYSGGTIISINGVQVCKVKVSLGPTGYSGMNSIAYTTLTIQDGMPVQTPDAPGGMGAYRTGLLLKKGDKLTLNASGTWGLTKTDKNTFLTIFHFDISTNTCDDVNAAGLSTSGKNEVVNNPDNNQASALFGSDGTEAFLIGAGVKDRVINNNGTLQIGYNVPMTSASGCQYTQITNLSVQRCQDAAGATYQCP